MFSRLVDRILPADRAKQPSGPPAAPAAASLTVARPLEVISAHDALVRRIKMAYGFPDAIFERHVMTSITGLARYLHLLPASSTTIYPESGGAFRMALELGFFALHGADGRSFSTVGAGQGRDELRHHWRLACFLAGMFGELHRVFGRIEVVNQHGAAWPVGIIPLVDWLQQTSAKTYRVRFRDHATEARSLSIHVASQVIPPEIRAYLSAGQPPVISNLFGFLGTATPENNPLTDIVRRTASAVLDRNMRGAPQTSPAESGAADAVLLNSLRALASSPDWLPNGPGSRAWYGQDGFFVAWPAAAADLARCAPGIVSGAGFSDRLLQLLQEFELITLGQSGPLWRIQAPGMPAPIDAIRLAAPVLALGNTPRRLSPLPHLLALRGPAELPDDGETERPPQKKSRAPAKVNPTFDLFSEQVAEPEEHRPPLQNPGEHESNAEVTHALAVRFRTTVNPLVRDALESIVVAVDKDNESVIAAPHEHGLFISAEAWEAAGIDSAVAIRSLFDAGMLHINPQEPNKRVFAMALGDATYSGCVIPGDCLEGWEQWIASRTRDPVQA